MGSGSSQPIARNTNNSVNNNGNGDQSKGASGNDEMVLLRQLDGDIVIKLLSLFSEEIDANVNFQTGSLLISKDRAQNVITIEGKAHEVFTADAIITKWCGLLDELKCHVINPGSYDNNTINLINGLIKNNNLESRVVAIPFEHFKIVRLYGKNWSHLMQIENEFRTEEDKSRSVYSINADEKFQFVLKGLAVKLYKEAITKVDVDAIVSAANDKINNCRGVAEVISKAAGESMDKECKDFVRQNGKLVDGLNIITSAGRLKYKAIIHAVGPRWNSYKVKTECLNVLATTINNILQTASGNEYRTIAMPPISSGIFAVPREMCAAMYIRGILDFCQNENLGSLKEFHIIDIYDDVLDMIQKWYLRWEKEPSCLEPNKVLNECSEKTKPSKQKQSRFPLTGQQSNNYKNEEKDNTKISKKFVKSAEYCVNSKTSTSTSKGSYSDNRGRSEVESSRANEKTVTSMDIGGISCPVCMDDYRELQERNVQLMSTNCGHIFCKQCIEDFIQTKHCCPTCRKDLRSDQVHQIFL